MLKPNVEYYYKINEDGVFRVDKESGVIWEMSKLNIKDMLKIKELIITKNGIAFEG